MSNREQICKDMAIACDFIEQIISDPTILDKIPDGAVISFLDSQNIKPEKEIKYIKRKYIKVKRQFEIL